MKHQTDRRAVALALAPSLERSRRDSIYRRGSRWRRDRDEQGSALFTVITKLDLVALYLEAAGFDVPKKRPR